MKLHTISVLASDLPNSGSATVTFNNLDIASGLRMITIFISPNEKDGATISTENAMVINKIGFWGSNVFLAFFSDEEREQNCYKWIAKELTYSDNGTEILKRVREEFPCPPTYNRAAAPNSGLRLDNEMIDVFHPKAENCFRQLPGTE